MTPPDSAQFPVVIARALSQHVPTADGMLAILSEIELTVKAGETLAVTGASAALALSEIPFQKTLANCK